MGFVAVLLWLSGFCFGQGLYTETKVKGLNVPFSGTGKAYMKDGNLRTVSLISPSTHVPKGGEYVSLTLRSAPGKVYVINEKLKTYKEKSVDDDPMTKIDSGSYELIPMAKEKVNGYNCDHYLIKNKGIGLEVEIWLSSGIANYKFFRKELSKMPQNGLRRIYTKNNMSGYIVRMIATMGESVVQQDVVKLEKMDCPDSLFSLSGYTKEN